MTALSRSGDTGGPTEPVVGQSERPSTMAVAIGEWLEKNPPRGHRDSFSAIGWARIADAVLIAKASIEGKP